MKRNYFRLTLSILSPILVIGIVYLTSANDNFMKFMNGELSVKHEYFENDCKMCHVPWHGVNNDACNECHYDAPYDVEEELTQIHLNPSEKAKCFICHREHQGRSHDLNVIEDIKAITGTEVLSE